MANDPIVQILIEAAQRGRDLRRQREAQQAAQQADRPANDDERRDDTLAQHGENTGAAHDA